MPCSIARSRFRFRARDSSTSAARAGTRWGSSTSQRLSCSWQPARGARVVKHGNRGITSKSGGADVLEALGVRIDLPPQKVRDALETAGCAFLFAPLYHPAFKAVGPVRKALAEKGITTVFNLLGPLLNPVRPDFQLSGIFDETRLQTYIETFVCSGGSAAMRFMGLDRESTSTKCRSRDQPRFARSMATPCFPSRSIRRCMPVSYGHRRPQRRGTEGKRGSHRSNPAGKGTWRTARHRTGKRRDGAGRGGRRRRSRGLDRPRAGIDRFRRGMAPGRGAACRLLVRRSCLE